MKCHNCGHEVNPFETSIGNQEYYARMQQNHMNYRNQLAAGMAQSMTNPWNRQYVELRGTSEPESETPKPEPKQTAWGQFKDLIKRIIP